MFLTNNQIALVNIFLSRSYITKILAEILMWLEVEHKTISCELWLTYSLCSEVGRAAGENMRISNYEGGSKREFFFLACWRCLEKDSITLLQARRNRQKEERRKKV